MIYTILAAKVSIKLFPCSPAFCLDICSACIKLILPQLHALFLILRSQIIKVPSAANFL